MVLYRIMSDQPKTHNSDGPVQECVNLADVPQVEPLNLSTKRTVEDLPNETLQLILDHLPFDDLLKNVPLVSQKWCAIQKLVCHRKTSIQLYGDPESVIPEPLAKIFCKYIGLTLQSDTTTSFHCKYSVRREGAHNRKLLRRKFPNISSLSVVQFRLTPELDSLYDLLKNLKNLVGFKIICYRVKEDDNTIWTQICKKINRMKQLRELALFSRCPVSDFDCERLYLPMLKNIENLHIGGIYY